MSKWDEKRLFELCQNIFSGGTPSTSNSDYWDGEFYWLSSGETSNKYITTTYKTITQIGIDNSSTRLAKASDVVMACAGQGKTRGQTSYLRNNMYINQSVIALSVNEDMLNSKYLLHYLSLKYEELRYLSDANSTRGSITTDMLKKMKIAIPNLPTQERIADILSTYDDLIENNNRRIELLEKAAQELYKEWFVRFRFPNHENTKFVNGLPDGWNRQKINKFYNTTSGGTPSRKKAEYFENGIYSWVKTGEIKDGIIIDTEEHITEEAIKNSSAKLLPSKSVAMAMYGVNIGMLSYFDKEMACNQACCVFIDKQSFSSKHYLFYYLKSIREYLLLIGFGAAQQNLSQDLIKKIKILMPSDEIVSEFENEIEPIYNTIKSLQQKNQNLKKQRDLLLPRLMSGKLEV